MKPVCLNRIRGKFEFDPPIGARLGVGEHTLTARFRPDDVNSCIQNESVTSTITIVKAVPPVVWAPKETTFYYGEWGESVSDYIYI